MTAVAELGGEHHAGRTCGRRMAVVLRRMLAGMRSGAGALAERLFGAAWHWRIYHFSSALAVKLLKAAAIARWTVAAVAGLVTLVLAAAQCPVAGKRAGVIYVDTALGIAFVLATAALLRTASLAAGIVRSCGQLPALDHLIHVAAATLHCRLLGTRRALAQVTVAGALVRMSGLSAAQRPRADTFTYWYGI